MPRATPLLAFAVALAVSTVSAIASATASATTSGPVTGNAPIVASATRDDAEAPTAASDPFATLAAAHRALEQKVRPSVVSIITYLKLPEGYEKPAPEGEWELEDEQPHLGHERAVVSSGFVAADGTVYCCRTPLNNPRGGFADIIEVESSQGNRYLAEVVGSEPTINIAVLRPKLVGNQRGADLVPATIGRSEALDVGEPVFAFGDPYGSARTHAPGVVMSMPAAACYQADLTGSFIHASMAVDAGSVGGPLVDRRGEIVGLVVPPPSLDPLARPAPLAHVTYAMQIDTVLGVGEAIMRKRSNTSPWMGFSVLSQEELKGRVGAEAFTALARPDYGIAIDDVYTPSPATKAGVRKGYFLLSVNGVKIFSVVDFQQSLYYFAGTSVPIEVFRDGEVKSLYIEIAPRPVEANRF